VDEFRHGFVVVAAGLNYESELFTVTHGIDFYPLRIDFNKFGRGLQSASSEQELIALLDEFFHSERTTRLVNSLLAQLEG
jgi:hypothetical protein